MVDLAADSTYALSIRVGEKRFTLAASEVEEILRKPRVSRVPNAPRALDGVANLRGSVLPVFSLAKLLGLAADADGLAARVIVLKGAALGLAVDEVTALDTGRGKHRPLDIESLLARQVDNRPQRSQKAARETAVASVQATQNDDVALLGFELGGQAYALPLSHVEEVSIIPDAVATLPHSEAADLGVIAWRDGLLPLIGLRALLGLPGHKGRHVVVTRMGAARAGFIVDRLDAVLRARQELISPVPAILNRGPGEARIVALYRAPGGRLVSLLSPDRLFADPVLAESLAEGRVETGAMQTEASEEKREQIVVFRLGEEEYGLPISAVDEVARLPDVITRLPRSPAFIEGVMNLRGRVIPLIDQSRRFDVHYDGAQRPERARKRVIVTHLGDVQAGFIVDSVSEILNLSASQLQVAPAIGSTDAQTFDRVAMLDVAGRMILLVDPRELLDRAERDVLAALTADELTQAVP